MYNWNAANNNPKVKITSSLTMGTLKRWFTGIWTAINKKTTLQSFILTLDLNFLGLHLAVVPIRVTTLQNKNYMWPVFYITVILEWPAVNFICKAFQTLDRFSPVTFHV